MTPFESGGGKIIPGEWRRTPGYGKIAKERVDDVGKLLKVSEIPTGRGSMYQRGTTRRDAIVTSSYRHMILFKVSLDPIPSKRSQPSFPSQSLWFSLGSVSSNDAVSTHFYFGIAIPYRFDSSQRRLIMEPQQTSG